MRILLVCAGGMSTGILMKKMEKWCAEKKIESTIKAVGLGDYEYIYNEFDCILVGPQVSYQFDTIKSVTKKPAAMITPMDYALGNVENIMKLVEKLLAK